MRLFSVRGRGVALGRVYDNVSLRNPRAAAHAISDDIHQSQSGLRGVAKTKLTFVSDRDNERVVDTVETRNGKEIYVADYDGANQMRVTANRRLNITPSWSPDGRSIAYTSYTRVHPQIIVSNVYQGTRETLTDEKTSAFMPVYSPDGVRIAFMSQRDGNSEIYVMNRDGSGRAPPHQPPVGRYHADVVTDRHADRVYVGSFGLSTDLGHGRRWLERAAAHLQRLVGRSRNLVAGSVQRNRLRRTIGPGFRYQDLRRRVRSDARGDRRLGQQREPGLLAQRASPRIFVDAPRQSSDIHDGTRRQRAQTDYARRQQYVAELVTLRPSKRTPMKITIAHLHPFFLSWLARPRAARRQPPVARPTPPAPPPPATADARRRSARADARAGSARAAAKRFGGGKIARRSEP